VPKNKGSSIQFIVLAALALFTATWLHASGPQAWFQSPVSPLTTISPVVPRLPAEMGHPERVPARPTPGPPVVETVLRPGAWSSPLPWIAVGLPVFGLLAWAIAVLLDRTLPLGG